MSQHRATVRHCTESDRCTTAQVMTQTQSKTCVVLLGWDDWGIKPWCSTSHCGRLMFTHTIILSPATHEPLTWTLEQFGRILLQADLSSGFCSGLVMPSNDLGLNTGGAPTVEPQWKGSRINLEISRCSFEESARSSKIRSDLLH